MSFEPENSPELLDQGPLEPVAESTPTIEPPIVNKPKLWSRNSLWRDVVEIALLVIMIYTLVNLATARAIVEGNSMQPNFQPKQLIVVNRFAYYFGEPHRGDVIVLHNPTNLNDDDLIKRVIGLPGDTIKIVEGRVYINGVMVSEPYIVKFCDTGCDGTWTLGQNQYFVLGDNRSNSLDSHIFGPINRALIVGQAWIRYWPLQDAQMIPHPDYPDLTKQFTVPKDAN